MGLRKCRQPEPSQSLRKIDPGWRIVGIEAQCVEVFDHGGGRPAGLIIRDAQVEVRNRVAGIQANGRPVLSNRPGRVAQRQERIGEIAVGGRRVGLEADRFLRFAPRRGKISGCEERGGEVVVRAGIGREFPDRVAPK